ncbi:MAG: 50S ribosome-binding GTPase, partial [Clostridia bacterium]|nr:50S ribosome-binding GTPase [Clostridia bacterium]
MLKLRAKTMQKVQTPTRKVVLAGNPNAGKTTLFNALTRSNLKTGNFHGVTTRPASKIKGEIEYCDVPGMYSFNSYTMEEDSAAEACKTADLIINVVDATTLENSLNLTRRLIALNKNTVVYLTKLDILRRRGGWVDTKKLSSVLGVPVVDCSAKQLKAVIENNSFEYPDLNAKNTLNEAYSGGNCSLSKVEKLFYNRFFALAFFIATLTLTFFITFHPSMAGAKLKELCEKLFIEDLGGWLCAHISNPLLASFVEEGVIGGVGGVLSF